MWNLTNPFHRLQSAMPTSAVQLPTSRWQLRLSLFKPELIDAMIESQIIFASWVHTTGTAHPSAATLQAASEKVKNVE
jgi:hypothetical protein